MGFFYKQVPVASWFDDMSDTELRDLIPFFNKLSSVDNVYTVLQKTGEAGPTPPSAAELEAQQNEANQHVDTSPITQVTKPSKQSLVSPVYARQY